MESKRNNENIEVKPQSEKKVWVTPALEIISTDDVETGSTIMKAEGSGPAKAFYYS